MNRDQFWQLIEASRQEVGSCEEQAEKLAALLETLDAAEIIAFDNEFFARRAESYRWDLWAVAYIVNGGCSDDGFEYFRCWLIAQGRDYFEAALQDPKRAAERASDEDDNECEDLMSAPDRAYKHLTGADLPPQTGHFPAEPTGEKWDDDDLDRLSEQIYGGL